MRSLRRKRQGSAAPRRLLLVGNTVHYRDADGRYCTLHALARQLDQWFAEFDEIVIAAVLSSDGEIPAGYGPYEPAQITFVPLRQAGGQGIRAKFDVLRTSLSWVRVLVPLLRRTDVVHLRTPCNVTLMAIPLARVLSPHRYAIYAGPWNSIPGTSLTYRMQRWMLRRFGGVVHVYAPRSEGLAPNLRPNFSPTFTEQALDGLVPATERRLARLAEHPPSTNALRICCIARFTAIKNQVAVAEAAAILRQRGIPVEVRFAGVGAAEADVRDLVERHGMEASVSLLGRCTKDEVLALYEWADVNVLVSIVEGFGRVYLEGMAIGCPPVCGPGAIQAEMVGDGARGRQVDPPDAAHLADKLEDLRSLSTAEWEAMSASCRAYVHDHTLEAFGRDVRDLLDEL